MADVITFSHFYGDGSKMYRFHCPGCGNTHFFRTPAWTWNGSTDKPTVTPSVLVNGFSPKPDDMLRCHSFITDGKIQFLDDCEHALKGQTVDLPPADIDDIDL